MSLRPELDRLRREYPLLTPEQRVHMLLGPLATCSRCRERMDAALELCALCAFETRAAA